MEPYYYRRLKDLRVDHDYTQSKLGVLLGMSKQQYFLYESGQRDIPTPALITLAKLYDTSVDYILGLTDDPAPSKKNGSL